MEYNSTSVSQISIGAKNHNSNTKAIKCLLLQAWRERWSDIQWGINLKKHLPLSHNHNGDTYSLSELILEQALVGISPNAQVLIYLKYCISTQVVSLTATLRAIMKYDDLNKPYCIKSLMELTEGFLSRASHYGVTEEAMALSKVLLNFIEWLLACSHKALQKVNDSKGEPEFTNILDKACDVLSVLIENRTTRAMLHIAILDEAETFRQIEQTEANVRGTLGQLHSATITSALRSKVDSSLKLLNRISEMDADAPGVLNMSTVLGNPTISILLPQEAILNPTGEIQPFIDQLILVEKLQGLNRPSVYCDVIKACFYGLIDAGGSQEELKWVAFTFLKLPQILQKMEQIQPSFRESGTSMEQGIELLLRFTPLLDLTDTRCNCDCLHFLLLELWNKYNNLTEHQCRKLMAKRQSESRKSKNPEQNTSQPSPSLILRAEPTVTSILKKVQTTVTPQALSTSISILKTLDADYSKNQDALLGVLCHMMSGKSFELILAAAAATGKLQSFAVKLIKFNEFAKSTTGEGGKAAHIRALLFDISFLMLCHITQLYGVEIITQQRESAESFFAQWALRCLPEDGRFRSLDAYLPPDQAKVDSLITQFNVGGELKQGLAKWHEVCNNTPAVIQEVLIALEHGALSYDNVKIILDNIRSKMCSLPVVVGAWLCSYINISSEDIRQHPLNMLQQLKAPAPPDPSQYYNERPNMQQLKSPAPSGENNQYYQDRSHLMSIVLKRMTQDLVPAQPGKQTVESQQYLKNDQLAYDLLVSTLKSIFKKGCTDIKSVHTMEQLLNVGGAVWFCDCIIKEMLTHSHPEELQQAVCMVYGLFYMDIEQLTLCLITNTIPRLLQGSEYKMLVLIDPRGKALAQLVVMCITVSHQMKQYSKDLSSLRRARKRGRKEIEMDEDTTIATQCSKKSRDAEDDQDEAKPNKQRKLLEEEMITLDSEGFNLDMITAKEDAESMPTYDTRDPLNKAMVKLFGLFSSIVGDSLVSPRTGFVVSFVKEAIKCGGNYTRFILQFMPANMVSQMMKSLPGTFTTDLLLSVCDLTTSRGRCIAAKAVCQSHRQEQKSRGSNSPPPVAPIPGKFSPIRV
ncbi:mediator of RNA polymerase II transcription subunit 24-like [Lineus longissimus]|uniref:mediator of RNA polymerase II transcription subunit 24-like n=1 Tax=Lineus longissimus TaxID=88925 RepID=UPI00315CD2C0